MITDQAGVLNGQHNAMNHAMPARKTDIFETPLAPLVARLRLLSLKTLCAHAKIAPTARVFYVQV